MGCRSCGGSGVLPEGMEPADVGPTAGGYFWEGNPGDVTSDQAEGKTTPPEVTIREAPEAE